MNTISFVPEHYRDKEIILFITQCLDYLLEPSIEDESIALNADESLLPEYTDVEAVNAYYYKFIYPKIGTLREMEFLLRLIGLSGIFTEWFDYASIPFKFKLDLYANGEKDLTEIGWDRLVSLINAYKNERSHLDFINLNISQRSEALRLGVFTKISEEDIIYPSELTHYDIMFQQFAVSYPTSLYIVKATLDTTLPYFLDGTLTIDVSQSEVDGFFETHMADTEASLEFFRAE